MDGSQGRAGNGDEDQPSSAPFWYWCPVQQHRDQGTPFSLLQEVSTRARVKWLVGRCIWTLLNELEKSRLSARGRASVTGEEQS